MGNTALAVEAIVVAVGDVLVLVAGEVEVAVATEDTTNSSGVLELLPARQSRRKQSLSWNRPQ